MKFIKKHLEKLTISFIFILCAICVILSENNTASRKNSITCYQNGEMYISVISLGRITYDRNRISFTDFADNKHKSIDSTGCVIELVQ